METETIAEKGRVGEGEKGRVGEWENGRMGEGEKGRKGECLSTLPLSHSPTLPFSLFLFDIG